MLLVVLDDFLNNEIQELLRELGVEIGVFGQLFQPGNLGRFPCFVRWGKVVFGLEFAHRLGVGEPLGQRIDKNGIEPVDAGAVAGQKRCGAGDGVGHDRASNAGKPTSVSRRYCVGITSVRMSVIA